MPVYKRTWKRKDGTTAVRYYLHRTIDGQRSRVPLKTARTMAQAKGAADKLLDKLHEGTYKKPVGNMKLKEFIGKIFVPWSKENKRSWRSDMSRLKPILEFFGSRTFKQISDNPFLIESYKSKRLKTPIIHRNKKGEVTGRRPRSKHSVNRELRLLSRIFTLAITRKEAASNPVASVELFAVPKNRKRRLKPQERRSLLAALAAPSARCKHLPDIVLLDLNSGLRKTELLSLTPEQIDFEGNIIRVVETKNGEDREVEMNATARAILLRLVEQARGNGWAYVFTNPKTGTRYKDVRRSFASILKEAGIENFRYHDLRHTFASLAGDDPEVSIAALAETLGHKDWKTTMGYTHASKQSKLRVVQAQEESDSDLLGHKSVTKEERQAS
jgi:integrase